MKNKKGFTLIELLAVIVILAIIALIAVPIILNMINQANKSAAKSSALGYIDAIEYNNGFAAIEQPGYTSVIGNDLDVTNITVKLKGKKPSSGTVTVNESGKVTSAEFCINGYTVEYDGKDAEVKNKCNESSQPSIPEPVSFSTDSWATIAANTTSDKYHVGDTKEIQMDINDDGISETYILRLVNNTTPSECSTTGFSQTACGFVVDFTDGITTLKFNNVNDTDGGWKDSILRNYMNDTIYNKLPSDLKPVIKTTYVVSGSGGNRISDDTEDRLFSLSVLEVGYDHPNDNKKDKTRILDYYNSNNNDNSRIKNSKPYWLRTAASNSTNGIYIVAVYGGINETTTMRDGIYISPAFRIGN